MFTDSLVKLTSSEMSILEAGLYEAEIQQCYWLALGETTKKRGRL